MPRNRGKNPRVTLYLKGFNSIMKVEKIPYCDTGYFSKIICDYLNQKEAIQPYFNRFSEPDAFRDQIKEKSESYPEAHREVLVQSLEQQYKYHSVTKATAANIKALSSPKTFTVVTGHQLSLFTGPLYFLYKIISVINLCEQLKKAHKGFNFVPVYWMASEDHDFEEINHFNLHGKNIAWNIDSAGAVGHLSTKGLEEVLKSFQLELGQSSAAKELADLFRAAYLEHKTLAAATRHLVNALFGKYGLVILDGDDSALKKISESYILQDVKDHVPFHAVTETIDEWQQKELGYKVQVNPRPINFFYLAPGLRERVEEKDGRYQVLNSDTSFDNSSLQSILADHPERFSPNVIMRPVYQEVVLPNLCYIGGGGEIAYWLEMKRSFEALKVPFPILLLRNSVLLMSEKQYKKMGKLGLNMQDLFLEKHQFINKKVREISNINIDFGQQKKHLKEQFEALHELAEQTDATFLGAVKAQQRKQEKGLEHLEKRLLRAQKRKLKDQVKRMTDLKVQLFPNDSLQERQANFSEFYLEIGTDLIDELKKHLDPLDLRFTILRY